jgi:ribosomal protein S18 acetylase RimI-like enzyme
MLVRQAVNADVPFVEQLQQKWSEEDNTHGFVPESREQIENALASYLVAEVGGRVVGFISGAVRTGEGTAVIPAGESYFDVDNLYVMPEFRNRGVGGSLITHRLAQAKQQGVSYALVYSAAKNIKEILKFYERHNFQSWYVQMFRKL